METGTLDRSPVLEEAMSESKRARAAYEVVLPMLEEFGSLCCEKECATGFSHANGSASCGLYACSARFKPVKNTCTYTQGCCNSVAARTWGSKTARGSHAGFDALPNAPGRLIGQLFAPFPVWKCAWGSLFVNTCLLTSGCIA